MAIPNISFDAFTDELTKISGEMQGFTRMGRRPITVEKMLENESQVTGLPDDFIKQSMSNAAKAVALLGAGGATALVGRQALADHKLGRQIRRQQQ